MEQSEKYALNVWSGVRYMLHNAGIDVGGVRANHSAHTEKHTLHIRGAENWTQVHTNIRCTQSMSVAHNVHTASEERRRAQAQEHNGGAESKGMSQKPNTIKFLPM